MPNTDQIPVLRLDLQTGEVFQCPADAALVFDTAEDAKRAADTLNDTLPDAAGFSYVVR